MFMAGLIVLAFAGRVGRRPGKSGHSRIDDCLRRNIYSRHGLELTAVFCLSARPVLIKFKTDAYADIIMFGDVAQQLLKMMGHSGTVPSAILLRMYPLRSSVEAGYRAGKGDSKTERFRRKTWQRP